MSEVTPMKINQKNRGGVQKVIIALLAIITVASIAVAGYALNEANNAKSETPEAVAERNLAESQRVIAALNSVLATESEEDPTVARVEDPEVLRQANEDFYRNAAEGDYLILYPQRAVLFRESEKRVINVAPILNADQLRVDSEGTSPAETTPTVQQPGTEVVE